MDFPSVALVYVGQGSGDAPFRHDGMGFAQQ